MLQLHSMLFLPDCSLKINLFLILLTCTATIGKLSSRLTDPRSSHRIEQQQFPLERKESNSITPRLKTDGNEIVLSPESTYKQSGYLNIKDVVTSIKLLSASAHLFDVILNVGRFLSNMKPLSYFSLDLISTILQCH